MTYVEELLKHVFYDRMYKAACDNFYNCYKFLYLPDSMLICLKSSDVDKLLLTYSFSIFVHIDMCNFFRQHRKLVEEEHNNGNQQVGEQFYENTKENLLD